MRIESAPGPALPGPFAAPTPSAGIQPTVATVALARRQVRELLLHAPAFRRLEPVQRRRLAHGLVRIAAYLAELVRDDWKQSEALGQRPMVPASGGTAPRRAVAGPARSLKQPASFEPATTRQVAAVAQQTLRAIAFPTFVADLIRGAFQAIVHASIEQMEAYVKLIENVSKTVDQFMVDNISDQQARVYLAEQFPQFIEVRDGRAAPTADSDRLDPPDWRRHLNLLDDVVLDERSIEQTLVPAARRKLAQSRLQTLATLVMMGIQRIVVTRGRIHATMGFQIDAGDRLQQQQATELDSRAAASGRFGFGPWQASASTSVAYVRSTRVGSDSQINVQADLTGKVDLHFQTDYFPLRRFAGGDTVEQIRGNTAEPEANEPTGNKPEADEPGPGGASPPSPEGVEPPVAEDEREPEASAAALRTRTSRRSPRRSADSVAAPVYAINSGRSAW